MLPAFLTHTVLPLCNQVYQQVRALTRYLFFANRDDLLAFMLAQPEPAPD